MGPHKIFGSKKIKGIFRVLFLILAFYTLIPLFVQAEDEPVTFIDVSETAGFKVLEGNSGVAWTDYNNDGWEDIYIGHHGAPVRLYRNNGDGTFTDVAESVGIVGLHDRHGSSWGDTNNDGRPDLYITAGRDIGGSQLFINQADGTFIEQAEALGALNHWGRGRQVQWIDYNYDGFLDLHVGNATSYFNTLPDQLYKNKGDGTFTNVSDNVGLDIADDTRGFSWVDYNNDGFIDLVIGGISGDLVLYKNKNGNFSDVTDEAGLPRLTFYTTDWGDYDNDGDLDLYVGRGFKGHSDKLNVSDTQVDFTLMCYNGLEEGISFTTQGDHLYFNLSHLDYYISQNNFVSIGKTSYHPDDPLSFTLDTNDPMNEGQPSDYDAGNSDGIFIWKNSSDKWHVRVSADNSRLLINGIISSDKPLKDVNSLGFDAEEPNFRYGSLYQNQGDGTFKDVTKASGTKLYKTNTHDVSWVDIDNDADLDLYIINEGAVSTGNQSNQLYRNNGDGTFTDIAPGTLLEKLPSGYDNCGGWADYNHDGFMDLFLSSNWWVLNMVGPEKLLQNQGNGNHWLQIDLVGKESNPLGLGAKIKVITKKGEEDLLTQYKEVHQRGSDCQDSATVHFGLGQQTQVEKLIIQWPLGKEDILYNVPADQRLTIEEGAPPLIALDSGKSITALPGESITLEHKITNMGFQIETVHLDVDSSQTEVNPIVSPPSIELNPGMNSSVKVNLQVPSELLTSTTYHLTISVQPSSDESREISVVDVITVEVISVDPPPPTTIDVHLPLIER